MVSRKALVRRPSPRLPEGIVDHIERVPVDYEFARSCLVFLTTLIAGLALAKEEPPAALDKAALEQARRPIVLSVPGMERVVVHSNLTYTQTNDPLVRMDVYVPADLAADERRSIVMLVHGGVPASLPVKDMGAYRSWGRLIAAHGMVAVTFTHRLRWPLSQLRESASDVRAAIDFARANASKVNADPDRMCIAAYSAAGPLLTVALQDERRYVRCSSRSIRWWICRALGPLTKRSLHSRLTSISHRSRRCSSLAQVATQSPP